MLFKGVFFKVFRLNGLIKIICLRLIVLLQIICLFSACFCFNVASGKNIIAFSRNRIVFDKTIIVFGRTIIQKDSSLDIANLVASRYGHADSQTVEAWKVLTKMGYKPGAYLYPTPNTILEFPSFAKVLRIEYPSKNYLPSTWLSVWDQMIQAIPANKDNKIFMADLMQISASVLFRNATYLHFRCAHAFAEKDKKDLKRFSNEYLAVMADIDHLIYGNSFKEKFQETLSPKCTPEFKHCISNYYLIRWKLWLDYSLSCILNHHKIDSSFIAEKIRIEVKNSYLNSEHSIRDKTLVDISVKEKGNLQIDFVRSLYLRFRDARLSDLE